MACISFQKLTKMFHLDVITNKNNKAEDKKWSYIMLIIGPSGSGKTNSLVNLIQKQDNDSLIDNIYLYAEDLSEPKYHFLIKKLEDSGIKNSDDPSAFTEYSSTIGDVYNNIHDYNSKRKRKVLIVFDGMIADVMTNKKFQAIVKELFIRCRNLNISLVFIRQSYFSVPKEVRLNSTHYLITKIHNKRELKNTGINHSADIDYKVFVKIYTICTNVPYSFWAIETTLPAGNPMRFRKNFIKMTLTEQVKILNDKIKVNKAQYDLDREAVKISAL